MADMSEFVSIHVSADRPGIGTLAVSRPPTNAMTRQVYREIGQAATEIARRDDIATVIIFGGHEIFSAGDDMPQLRTLIASEAESWAGVRRDAVDAVAAIPKPTVAAITGYALGAGLGLALAADWRVSGDNVRFGATEILAGLVPDGGGMARLTRTVGVSKAKELVYSGRFFDAEEALALGRDRRHGRPRRRLRRRRGLGRAFCRRTPGRAGCGKGRHRRGVRAGSGRADGRRTPPLCGRVRRCH